MRDPSTFLYAQFGPYGALLLYGETKYTIAKFSNAHALRPALARALRSIDWRQRATCEPHCAPVFAVAAHHRTDGRQHVAIHGLYTDQGIADARRAERIGHASNGLDGRNDMDNVKGCAAARQPTVSWKCAP